MMLTGFSQSLLVISHRQLLTVTRPVVLAKWITYSSTMSDTEDGSSKLKEMKREMFHMYQHAVSAVKPSKLVSRILTKCDDKNYIVNGRKYILNNNVYVVGFGKAVLDMAFKVNEALGDHIVYGILSIPAGTRQPPEVEELKRRNIQIREGAANNLPDTNAECTAREIGNLVDSLGDDMLLLVLISGGGSALLPAPLPGITVEDTAQVVSQLQSRGASISEINSVRKKLCSLKGGKLAMRASPAQVISLILSDIVGDPLDFIASGPTVENKDSTALPLQIIEKYELLNKIQNNVLQELEKTYSTVDFPQNNVFNVLIGSNITALQAAREYAVKAKYFPVVISDKISCPVTELCEWYSSFCINFWKAQRTLNYEKLESLLLEGIEKYGFFDDILEMIQDFNPMFQDKDFKGLCIIGGGEPTVQVKKRCGSKGGRSQELALRFSVKMHELTRAECCNDTLFILMAAGTDGIDGPTDAAGAYGYSEQIDFANSKSLEPQKFIERSNSYGYFTSLTKDLIKVGHTGTNVMDLHVLIIGKK